MDFVNVLKSKLSKTAKGAVKVSNDAIEYTKLKIKLAETRDSIEELYAKIGRGVYEGVVGENESDVDIESYAAQITELKTLENELTEQLSVVTNKKICPHCGARVRAESVYCGACGEKLDV